MTSDTEAVAGMCAGCNREIDEGQAYACLGCGDVCCQSCAFGRPQDNGYCPRCAHATDAADAAEGGGKGIAG